MKQILIVLLTISPILLCAQNWKIGGNINYSKSNLKFPHTKKYEFNKSINEFSLGITATKFFDKKIGLHFNLNVNNFWLVSETEDTHPIQGFDPEKDIKFSLNYLNPSIKLLYYKNNMVDGISIGLGTFIYLFQTQNYDDNFISPFKNHHRFYNVLSFGYYFIPIKNFMAELEFVGNITALGSYNFGNDKPKWEDKYWKYGLRVSITYNFLSLTKK